jgi:hypothetical protein
MRDGCITVKVDLDFYIQSLWNFSLVLESLFILIELNLLYLMWLYELLLYKSF